VDKTYTQRIVDTEKTVAPRMHLEKNETSKLEKIQPFNEEKQIYFTCWAVLNMDDRNRTSMDAYRH
jgi:hypothetical protein